MGRSERTAQERTIIMSTKVKKVAAHPPYANMITAAIKGLKDKKGSSRQAILKYVVANNKVDATKAAVRVKLALRKMVVAKKVVAAAGAISSDCPCCCRQEGSWILQTARQGAKGQEAQG